MSTPSAQELYEDALKDHKNREFETASQKLKQALEVDPKYDDAYEALSVMLYNLKRYDEAIDILKKWVKQSPKIIMAHTNLSLCYVAKGMIAEAEDAQAEARRLSWAEELKGKKQDMPAVDYDAQIEKFKKVIEFDPNDVLGYFSLGNVYLESGNIRDAVDTFEKAISVDPNHSSSYLGLGTGLEQLGDSAKATKIYTQGIQVADKQGDMLTQKKMESRLKQLKDSK